MSPISRHFSTTAPFATLPNTRTCIHLLKTCKSMKELKQIQAHLFKAGAQQNDDALKKLMAFCTDPHHGNPHYAERVFNYIENPSLFIYNVMIKAYTKSGSFKRSLFLYDQMRAYGLWPDNFTYPFVFKAIGRLKEALVGQKVHGYVIKCGLGFDCYVCNSVMDMYAELGYVGDLRKVFGEMPDRDLVSWNILISGFVRCNRFEDAVSVYRLMRHERSVRPDEATVVSTLSACIALKNLELGGEIHRYVSNELEITTIIGNSLLDMYSKCGCLSTAREIFDAMPVKNVICWTSMVSGYVNTGQLDEARLLFDSSPVRDIVLWTAMINGYVQFNRVDEAMALFQDMQMNRVKPDKYTMVTLLTGCAQLGALEQGKWIHEYMLENRIAIDAVTGTALIDIGMQFIADFAQSHCIPLPPVVLL
ncbi:hypothetical protein RJ639_039373 [Escallonia herrerae]|uniref:Pentatricopeptide repeat-containing protein n=1 Tax=Escallonia herrerae TaxID=1293975 RepID=A0AA89B831_9ASTE|nr:hypothetical protein RJ639_039373 [Escallonia herrerae]